MLPSPSRQNPGVSAVAAPDRRASPEERLGGLPSACLHVKKRFPCGNVCFCSPGFLNSLISLNIFLASGNWPCHEYDNNVFGDWKKLFCFPATGKKIWEVADRNAWTQIPAHRSFFAFSEESLHVVSSLSPFSDKDTPGLLKVFDTLYLRERKKELQ